MTPEIKTFVKLQLTPQREEFLQSLKFKDLAFYYHPELDRCFPVEITEIDHNIITAKGTHDGIKYRLKFSRQNGTLRQQDGILTLWEEETQTPRLVSTQEGEILEKQFQKNTSNKPNPNATGDKCNMNSQYTEIATQMIQGGWTLQRNYTNNKFSHITWTSPRGATYNNTTNISIDKPPTAAIIEAIQYKDIQQFQLTLENDKTITVFLKPAP